jgi:pre-rRNA-processing protein TSR3
MRFVQPFKKNLILRHRKENLKKCSLEGLCGRADTLFLTYPKESLPSLAGYCLLNLDAPPLSDQDAHLGIFLIDATWIYAEKMVRFAMDQEPNLIQRSIPAGWRTAYPRKQSGCSDPNAGLASIEALWIACQILGRPDDSLLDHYYWKESFLFLNSNLF